MSVDPRLKLRHLSGFLEIAQAGSLVAAADRLGVTQPALSKTLRELEEVLGKRLFDRSGRTLRLNPAGQVFQRFVGGALSDLGRAERAVRGASEQTTRIALGALPTSATELVPRAALAFRERHPECSVRAITGPNWLLMSQLREGALDLVVGRMAGAEQMTGLSFEQLYSEDVVAVVRAGHPWRRRVDAERLAEFPLVVPPKGAVIGPLVRNYLASQGGAALVPAMETVSLALGRGYVLGSDAIWFISRGVVAHELAAGQLRALSLDAPMMAGPVGVSLRENATLTPELRGLIDCLRAAAAALRATTHAH